jgi:hypothetical protein
MWKHRRALSSPDDYRARTVTHVTIEDRKRKGLGGVLLVAFVIMVASFGAGYLFQSLSTRAPTDVGQTYIYDEKLDQILQAFNTATPTITVFVTETPTNTPTTVPTLAPTATDIINQYDFCSTVGPLTPCVPYGTKVPLQPTQTPTQTPVPFCQPKDYETDFGSKGSQDSKPIPICRKAKGTT